MDLVSLWALYVDMTGLYMFFAVEAAAKISHGCQLLHLLNLRIRYIYPNFSSRWSSGSLIQDAIRLLLDPRIRRRLTRLVQRLFAPTPSLFYWPL